MKFPRIISIPGDSLRSVQAVAEQSGKILSGNVSFGLSNTDPGKNIQCWLALNVVAPGGPNTEFAVPHNLPYVPIGFWPIDKSVYLDLERSVGGTPWTKATTVLGNIYLKCNVGGATFSLIII